MKKEEMLTERNLFKGSFLPYKSRKNRKWEMVTDNVWVYTNRIVNICFIQNERKELIMVDAGMPNDYPIILEEINKKFNGQKPIALILTHGHFDHVGSLAPLLVEWDIPVFASQEELPYLNGLKDYPKGKFSTKGFIPLLSKTFPHHGIHLKSNLFPLPINGTVPFLEEWEWMATPGHTPGHVSFYNKVQRVLIAGDAVVTVKQESLFAVLTQRYSLNGPPAYFTPHTREAKKSIVQLLQRPIKYLVTGHGPVIRREDFIEKELKSLLKKYD